MKKIFTMLMVVTLVVAMTVSSFAAGAFVASPTGIAAPKLVNATNENVGCLAELVIESYDNRASLGETALAKMNAAYKSIKNTDDLSKLNSDLAAIADEYNIPSSALAVSDLFDISHVGCANHESCGAFTITIRPNTVENFVALMHFNGTSWELVETTVEDGCLTFTVDDFSPFAIIAHDGTGEAPISSAAVAGIAGGSIGALLIILIIIILIIIQKKKKNKKA